MNKFLLFVVISVTSISSLYTQPEDLPWDPDPKCESIVKNGIAVMTCAVSIFQSEETRYPIALANINGIVPESGRIDASDIVDRYHHPSWHIDSVGSLFGVTMDNCGNVYASASSNFSIDEYTRYFIIKYGSIPDTELEAAGAIYKIDAKTGKARLFSSLPQQFTPVVNSDCGFYPETRLTGPGLGNITYDFRKNQFFASNFEDGRIYRLNSDGEILDSFDPLGYDDGESGMPDIQEVVFGLAVHPDANRLYFGISGLVTAFPDENVEYDDTLNIDINNDMITVHIISPKLYSIELDEDRSFKGTIDNSNMPMDAIWNNFVDEERLEWTTLNLDLINFSVNHTRVFSFSDMEFAEDESLLLASRTGCDNLFSFGYGPRSYYHLDVEEDLYNDLLGKIYTGQHYGGISSYIDEQNNQFTAVSVYNDSIPWKDGISVQPQGSYGTEIDPVEPAGLFSFDPDPYVGSNSKGNGADIYIFRNCECACTEGVLSVEIEAPIACPGDDITFGTSVVGANEVAYEWSTGDTSAEISLILENIIYYVTVTDTCGFTAVESIYINASDFFSRIVVNFCDSFIAPSGTTYYEPGDIFDTVHIGSCDSIWMIELEEADWITEVLENGNSLSAVQIGVEYQWIDCNDNFNSIPSENGQSFTPDENGSYAVVIDPNNCPDTSACLSFTTSINASDEFRYKIQPNPSTGQFWIELPESNRNVKMKIFDSKGVLVKEAQLSQVSTMFNSNFEAGIYFIELWEIDKNNKATEKVVIYD